MPLHTFQRCYEHTNVEEHSVFPSQKICMILNMNVVQTSDYWL